MGEAWFSAGHYFGMGAAESAELLVKQHNERVEPRDTVWLLGNVATGSPESLKYLARLNGRKHLICGPEDQAFVGHEGFTPAEAKRYLLEGGLSSIVTGKAAKPIQLPFGFGYEPVLLWHFPYVDAPGIDDYATQWRPQPPRIKVRPWLLYGQTPSDLPAAPELRPLVAGAGHDGPHRQICVAVDAWDFAPAHQEQIQGIIGTA